MNPSYDNSFGSFSSGQGGNTNQPGYSGGSVGSNNQFGGGQQVFSSAPMGEPIKLDNGGRKKSKKWVVVLLAILILGCLGGLLVANLMNSNNNSDEKIVSFLSSDDSQRFIALEKMYFEGFHGEIRVDELFSEDGYNTFLENSDAAIRLNKGMKEFDIKYISNTIKDDFERIRNDLAERIEIYEKTVDFYKELYRAFRQDGASVLEQYLDEDLPEYVVADRFYRYLNKKVSLAQSMEENNCGNSIAQTDMCRYLIEENVYITNSLVSSTSTVQGLLGTYSDIAYTDEMLLGNKIQYIVNVLEGNNEK